MTVIKFDNVSKKYKLYSKGGLYLRDRITHALKRLIPSNGRQAQLNAPAPASGALTLGTEHALEKDFWALRNMSFEIKKGESVAFIGRNGAGKSTVLKLLAGVTKPSSGSVSVEGRVAAMIEVGAGFHPELTGRENVYLNGSILGMTKNQINERFDSIISFAELEDFVDTPVKHYSSGMYVRLGFAIAAHTDPDIYLIDEVLAVGDEAFQKKCLDTLAAHKAAGKTMILVTHSLDNVEEVCDRCIYVNHGEIRFDDVPRETIKQYRLDLRTDMNSRARKEGASGALADILSVDFYDAKGQISQEVNKGDDLIIGIRYRAPKRITNPVFGVAIHGPNGELVTGFNTRTCGKSIESIEGESSIFCRMPSLCLNDGAYSISVSLHDFDGTEVYDFHKKRYRVLVGRTSNHEYGVVALPVEWAWNQTCTEHLTVNPGISLGKIGDERLHLKTGQDRMKN